MPEPFNPYAPPVETGAEPYRQVPLPDTRLATRWQRFWGKVIDYALLFVLFFVWAQLVDQIDFGSLATFEDRFTARILPVVGGMLALAGVQWWLIATTGQTVGKKLVKTRVVRDDGRPVDFVTGVVVREWLCFAIGLVPGLGPLFNLADHLYIFGDERKTLHDRIAGTKVIDTEVALSMDDQLAVYAEQGEAPRKKRKRRKRRKPAEPVALDLAPADDGTKPSDP